MKDNQTTQIVARASFVRHSPRKMRLIADAVRPLNPMQAIDQLNLLPHAAAKTLLKVYKQALGNAKTNFQVSPADLRVLTLQIEQGAMGAKKADVHSHGARFNRGVRRKKTAHIKLILTTK